MKQLVFTSRVSLSEKEHPDVLTIELLVYQLLLIELPSRSSSSVATVQRHQTSHVFRKQKSSLTIHKKPVGNESIARRSLNERERRIT